MRTIRVLILEDNPFDAVLMDHELRRAGFALESTVIQNERDYLTALDPTLDVILADYSLPGFDALRALRLLQERGFDIPFVVVTGSISEEAAATCMKQGVSDYLLKDRLQRLGPAVERAIAERRLREEKRQADDALRRSEAYFRSAFENASIPVALCSCDGRLVRVNAAVLRMLGYKPNELLGKHFESFSHLDDLEPDRSLFRELVAGEREQYEIEKREFTSDGRMIWAHLAVSVVYDKDGRPDFAIRMWENITGRKAAEEEVKSSLTRLQTTLEGTIEAMGMAVEIHDPYTAGHQRRVAYLAAAIGRELHLSPDQISHIRVAGLVHDVGKIAVPSEFLNKPGRLTGLEISSIKTHPEVGYKILSTVPFPWPLANIVRQHHERLNGSGYPGHLLGSSISLEAMILAVADVVEAMASHRPYRAGLGMPKAVEEISANRDRLYDGAVVDACINLLNGGFQIAPDGVAASVLGRAFRAIAGVDTA